MADIVHLHGDPHERTQALLPWYVNGTLDAAERERLDSHLADCDACRADCDAEHALAQAIAALPMEAEAGWAAIKDRLAPRPPAPLPLYRQRVPFGWAVGAPVAAAAAAAMVVIGVGQPPAPPAYHALGNAAAVPRGNLIVMFRPDTPEAALRETLAASGARLVDGPTPSGAYVLQVADAARSGALRRLRADVDVTLAQPIDAVPGP